MRERVRELRRRLAPVLEVVGPSARRDLEELFELASQPADRNTVLLREVRDALDLVERATGVTTRQRTRTRPGRSVQPAMPASTSPARKARSKRAPAPAAKAKEAARREPTLLERLRALLASESQPLTPVEIANRLLASGWSTRSSLPHNVISAALAKSAEFERANGRYRLAGGEPPRAAEARRPLGRGLRPEVPLGERIHAILTRRGSTMTYPELLDELAREGWTSVSTRKRDVVANAVRLYPELELVLPGVVGIRGSQAADGPSPAPRPAAQPDKPPRPHREPRADREALAHELAFVRQHVADARDDTAVLAPAYAERQLSAWAARAHSIAERAGDHKIASECRTLVRELSTLATQWSLGRSVRAVTGSAAPRDALEAFMKQVDDEPSWETVADRLDTQLESAYDDPEFDDGWSDTRWLADDERFAPTQLDRTETLLERIGAPFGGPRTLTTSLDLGPKDLRDLVDAARGLRWVRGVALDGTRWGECMGRLRWLAQHNPTAKQSKLAAVLPPDYQPTSTGWGFDEDEKHEKREWLTSELANLARGGLGDWLTRAVDAFDDSEIARLLANRTMTIAHEDLLRLHSRRVRARAAKVMEAMGLSITDGPLLPELRTEQSNVPRFGTARALVAERLERRRTLVLSNRPDPQTEHALRSAFDLDLEWCVATPQRAQLAAESIDDHKPDLVFSASGFHTHTMDRKFASAATEAGARFIRVNRARPASCARALVRVRISRDVIVRFAVM